MDKTKIVRSLLAAFLFFGAGYGSTYWTNVYGPGQHANVNNFRTSPGQDTRPASSCNSFPVGLFLEEAPSPFYSRNKCWWVNSGAVLIVDKGVARTASGPIYQMKKWQELYAKDDPVDTEGGWYPQNIFRLINSVSNLNALEQVYFNIDRYRPSESPNRNLTNGVFLFFRYVDSQNLYLAGLRVDGTAVIKRKLNGIYQTLGSAPYTDTKPYDPKTNPNLLPVGNWIGIAVEAKNGEDGSVHIKFNVDLNDGRGWRTLIETNDYPNTLPQGVYLTKPGRGGIRTDFLDVKFKDYRVTTI
ncbi:MAG: hypothetical protein HYV68_02450 [Candidatus Taylorbacteria bacterium]|nr:hypothetical protein [Candidatus Taylorbacteria bacterium]